MDCIGSKAGYRDKKYATSGKVAEWRLLEQPKKMVLKIKDHSQSRIWFPCELAIAL